MEVGMKTYMEVATFGLALLGAVLGVLNAWRNWAHDRLRVVVDVGRATGSDGTAAVTISVRNLSRFDVTITSIGMHCIGRKEHMQLLNPIFTGGESLPERLVSRASFTVFQPVAALPPERWLAVDCVYIATACGNEVEGGRAVIRKYRAAFAQQSSKGDPDSVPERGPFKIHAS